jgi:hypothetical protein
MKTKTRKLIGSILVWGGLTVVLLSSIYPLVAGNNLSNITYGSISSFVISAKTRAYSGIIATISLLVGGLWGMRN